MKTWNKLVEECGTRQDMPLKAQVVTHTLNKLLKNDAIVSSDSGTIATWTARYVQTRGTQQFSLSGSLATMANGLPYSVGAAGRLATSGRRSTRNVELRGAFNAEAQGLSCTAMTWTEGELSDTADLQCAL